MPARPAFTAARSASAGTKLLEGGYVVEPCGDSIPYRALLNLNFDLATLNEGSYQYQEPLRTTGDVIAMYVRAGYLPADIPIRHSDTMAEALGLLVSHGITLGDLYADNEGSDWNSPQSCLGPAARPYFTPDTQASYDADPKNFPLMLPVYDGPEPHVAVGENLSEPSLPGSDALLESMPPFDRMLNSLGRRMRIRRRNGIARRMGAITGYWSWIGNTAWR